MRRILAGIVSGAVGGAIYLYLGPSKGSALAAGTVTLGTYGAIDWLGLLPPPFEQNTSSILHRDGTSEDER